jgi:FAD synthase
VVLLTFHPHPRKVIFGQDANGLEMLSSLEEKDETNGFNLALIILLFSHLLVDFSKMEYDDFVHNILVDKLGVKTLGDWL